MSKIFSNFARRTRAFRKPKVCYLPAFRHNLPLIYTMRDNERTMRCTAFNLGNG